MKKSGAEEVGISVDLECSNGIKLDHSECLSTCKAFQKNTGNRLLNVRMNNRSNER